ncbi:hypothetical protein T01_6050 [Trichinella spiralis]|uniref:Uncharacterized protein n=1 Tax=Trichinella spiralis TaxID=6334 RepID=A0A0V1AN49_TRISP|nr:hypothetical protein T01_3820 [Trichinella spiralis]KRY30994.1 hypothetical protein T01_6050 [Trichinella spiralis]
MLRRRSCEDQELIPTVHSTILEDSAGKWNCSDSRLWIPAVIETEMLYEKCMAMALRSAATGMKTPDIGLSHLQ